MPNKSVLIVEDDAAIREVMRIVMEFEGYTVFSAENGKEGLEVLAKIPNPCLVLLDLMMPVMDGWAFADRLQKDATLAATPIVVVTAFSERAQSIENATVLKKPVDVDVLLNTVKKYCA